MFIVRMLWINGPPWNLQVCHLVTVQWRVNNPLHKYLTWQIFCCTSTRISGHTGYMRLGTSNQQ